DASGKVRNITANTTGLVVTLRCAALGIGALHRAQGSTGLPILPKPGTIPRPTLAPSLPVLPVALPDGVHQVRISHLRGLTKIFASSIEQLLPQRFLIGSIYNYSILPSPQLPIPHFLHRKISPRRE
ncbi:hypothetical protein PspLS_11173, partial [Pyricularia sp. CBS 133598]